MRRLILSLALILSVVAVSAQGQNRRRAAQMRPIHKQMCLQLYSIRDTLGNAKQYAKNHVAVFKALKQYGYTSVEAANYNDGKFYGVSPQQFKKDLAAAGLTALSSHATYRLSDEEVANHDFTKALKWWDQAIAAHKAAGMKYIVTPWGSVPKNLKDGQAICDYYNQVGAKCRAAGLKYGYHTHSHEFQKVENQVWIYYMMNHISPENMFWQMDCYWCVMAQQAPVEQFKKFPGRFTALHIKDLYEIGQSGMVNFEAIFNNAEKAGLNYYVVEMEHTDGTIDCMEGVRRCAAYLISKRFVKPSYGGDK